jgi:hypothetical protein
MRNGWHRILLLVALIILAVAIGVVLSGYENCCVFTGEE